MQKFHVLVLLLAVAVGVAFVPKTAMATGVSHHTQGGGFHPGGEWDPFDGFDLRDVICSCQGHGFEFDWDWDGPFGGPPGDEWSRQGGGFGPLFGGSSSTQHGPFGPHTTNGFPFPPGGGFHFPDWDDHAHWDFYHRYCVPEPATGLLLLPVLVVAAVRRTRRV